MSSYCDEFNPPKSDDVLAAEAIREREEEKKRRVAVELLSSDAGKRQLVEELRRTLPLGGNGIFVSNSSIYRNAALADSTLSRLLELRSALTLETESGGRAQKQYSTRDIQLVLLSWFFNADICDF